MSMNYDWLDMAREAGLPVESSAWYYWDAIDRLVAKIQAQAHEDAFRVAEFKMKQAQRKDLK